VHDNVRTIRIGCDCAGIETPIMALENLGINISHQFSCDIDAAVRQVALANFSPATYYDDITVRNNSDPTVPRDLDLYVAGFPCQPFSRQGKQKGTADDRGRIITYIIKYIDKCRPRAFLLENVPGLGSQQHRGTLVTIIRRQGLGGPGG
jgi:DNA (cytosine-5)-methyltransferase 1